MNLTEIREKIKQKSSRETRNTGNPNEGDIDRELSRAGKKRKADDIPTQDTNIRNGKVKPGNVKSGSFYPSTFETKGLYKIGPAVRPHIVHDSGFSKFPKKDPELSDYWELFKWKSMLEGAETFRPDLTDGVAAYRHYLEGEAKPRSFSYDRYVSNDESGRLTLRNAILDAQDAAIELWQNSKKPNKFKLTGPSIPCGAIDPKLAYVGKHFPYPATENWQKAIGAHVIWLSADVVVRQFPGTTHPPEFKMNLVLHAEDQYNFNPGASDIATGVPDDVNGKFVVVGFAHGYYQSSVLRRTFSWKGLNLGVSSMGINMQLRQVQPQNNRSATNRI